MKKFTILLLMMTLSSSMFVFGQTYDLTQVKSSFTTFSKDTANALPLAANMGLNWNDAYSGSFPHFGVGLTAGAVLLPVKAFEEIYSLTGNGSLDQFSAAGLPLPVYSFDGRVGIPILPMDVGFKFGVLNPDMIKMQDFKVGFKMVGFDARWALLKDKGIMPDVSVGAGYTWLSGDIRVPVADQTVDISSTGAGNNLNLTDSDIYYNWSSNVLDFKAQVSKKLLILNLSAGAGYSYGFSTAGGGISAGTVDVDGTKINQTQIDQIVALTGVPVDTSGLSVSSDNNGGSFRLFGGVGLNLFILKIDLGVLYGLPSSTVGMTANARIQY